MAKYKPTDVPPGETKPINQMTVTEYKSWCGRCGGRATSQKKRRAAQKGARAKKPGLSMFHALVKRIANSSFDSVPAIMTLSTTKYPIDDKKAEQLLTAARAYRDRNPPFQRNPA